MNAALGLLENWSLGEMQLFRGYPIGDDYYLRRIVLATVKSAHLNAPRSTVYLDGAVESHSSHVTGHWTVVGCVWSGRKDDLPYERSMHSDWVRLTVPSPNITLVRTSRFKGTALMSENGLMFEHGWGLATFIALFVWFSKHETLCLLNNCTVFQQDLKLKNGLQRNS